MCVCIFSVKKSFPKPEKKEEVLHVSVYVVVDMANSKYEYVKSFEVDDEVLFPNLILVQIFGRDFARFSQVHGFDKPSDETALNLMNTCAAVVVDKYPDIVFSYGFSDEYSFVFKKTTKFYQRRQSKIMSLIVSFFTSVYTVKWSEFFPLKELRCPPSFHARVIVCPTIEVLQAYLAKRQNDCHSYNQYNTCFWMLVKSGHTEKEAKEFLEGKEKQDKNELLFQQFGINYTKLPKMFRKGSCIYKEQVEDVVKYDEKGTAIKRLRRKTVITQSGKIAGRSFWNGHSIFLKELGNFVEDIRIIKPEYIKSFLYETKLMPSTWTVIRIDGCHFHRFSEVHEFEKPNDKQALNLMNSCAVAVLEEFQDVIFSYGVSDEYSFVLKESRLCERSASELVSGIVSFFTSVYVIKWKTFFPHKELKYPPSFDGRAVCYPSSGILQDYLAWRQVDCHINNQYNTCFWMLVKFGKTKCKAQDVLKGTQALDKNELLMREFSIDYTRLPIMFRLGSSVFWEQEEKTVVSEDGLYVEKPQKKVVIKHTDIIEQSFWKAHPSILNEKPRCCEHCFHNFLSDRVLKVALLVVFLVVAQCYSLINHYVKL